MDVLPPAVRDSARASRAEIFRLQGSVGHNAKETRDIISRLRGDAGGEPAKPYDNPLPHWQSRKTFDRESLLGLGLGDADLEHIGVGKAVPGEFDLMAVAEEYGLRRDESHRAENPPSRMSLPRGAHNSTMSSGTLAPSWPSSMYQGADDTPEPVAVAAMQENLKLITKVRELERKCKQHQEELATTKEGRRRAEEESLRTHRHLEKQLQDATTRLLARDCLRLESAAIRERDAPTPVTTAASKDDTTAPVPLHRSAGRESGSHGGVSKYMADALQRLQDEIDDARAEGADEQKRANDLTYQLERLRCDTALEVAAAVEAAASVRGGVAAKAEECRELRKELDGVRLVAEETVRLAALEVEEAQQQTSKLKTRWHKVEESLEASRHFIPDFRQGDPLVSLLSAMQTLSNHKNTVDTLIVKTHKAEEDAVCGKQLLLEEKEAVRRQLREVEGRAEEYVVGVKEEIAVLRRETEREEEAATGRMRMLSVENEQLRERVRCVQEKLDDADERAMASEREKVQHSQENAKDALSRAADLRDEIAVQRDTHQRQLDALQRELSKELSARTASNRRADESAGDVVRGKALLKSCQRTASLHETQLQSACDAAVRELESYRLSSHDAVQQLEERLSRTLVRAETAEAELDSSKKALHVLRLSQKGLVTQLEDLRASQGRETASKGQTIESLRDALAASEEALTDARRALVTAKEETKWREDALQRQHVASSSAKERADSEAKKTRECTDLLAQNSRARVLELESQLEEIRSLLSVAAQQAAALEDEKGRLTSQLDTLEEQGGTIAKLSSEGAHLRAANLALQKLLDSKELDFAHAQAALKRRIEHLEHQRAIEAERTRRIECEKSRLDDTGAHAKSQLVSLREEVSDLRKSKDSLSRQVQTLREETAAAVKSAETVAQTAECAHYTLESQLSVAHQDRTSHEKHLKMYIDDAERARELAEGEAKTLRGEVSALKQLLENVNKDARQNQERVIRMETQIDEAAGQSALIMQTSTELELTRQRVQDIRQEKAQMALTHEKALAGLRDKINFHVLERERLESEVATSTTALKAQSTASSKGKTEALAQIAKLMMRLDLLQSEVDEKQRLLLECDRNLGRAKEQTLSTQRELDRSADSLFTTTRNKQEAEHARKLAIESDALSKDARLDSEARAEALARLNKDLERSLQSCRQRVDELEDMLVALEPQTTALDMQMAHTTDLERKLRDSEVSEGWLRRRVQETERRLDALQTQRLVDIKSNELLLHEAERELQSVHASRRGLKSDLDNLRSQYSLPPTPSIERQRAREREQPAHRGDDAQERERARDDHDVCTDASESHAHDFTHLRHTHAAAGRTGAHDWGREEGQAETSSDNRGEESDEQEGCDDEEGGDDEELLQIGRLQKARIETRLAAHGDPGPDLEALMSNHNVSEALGATMLALVLLLGQHTSSLTPSWSEVRDLIPKQPWSAMKQLQLHKHPGVSSWEEEQQQTKLAAKALALVLPAEAWSYSPPP